MPYSGRTSEEIFRELVALLVEYQEAIKEEQEQNTQRIDCLDLEVARLKTKNNQIAHILLQNN
jgi:hypothetical protein